MNNVSVPFTVKNYVVNRLLSVHHVHWSNVEYHLDPKFTFFSVGGNLFSLDQVIHITQKTAVYSRILHLHLDIWLWPDIDRNYNIFFVRNGSLTVFLQQTNIIKKLSFSALVHDHFLVPNSAQNNSVMEISSQVQNWPLELFNGI